MRKEQATWPPIKVYDGMLELSDKHIWWEIDNEAFMQDPVFDDIYYLMVQEELRVFKEETGVEISLLGRSGRHVCIEDTPENRERYYELLDIVTEKIKKFIELVNNYGKEPVLTPDEMVEHNNNCAVETLMNEFGCDEEKAKRVYNEIACIVVGSLSVKGFLSSAEETRDAENAVSTKG
jgi:hypothetical protein